MRANFERRPVSPNTIIRESHDDCYEQTIHNTPPKRGVGNNGSGDRSSIDGGPRVFTANTINIMERRKRKIYTSGRPSISQGTNNNLKIPNINETQSIASMTNAWVQSNIEK